jgi:hypothetical protein
MTINGTAWPEANRDIPAVPDGREVSRQENVSVRQSTIMLRIKALLEDAY